MPMGRDKNAYLKHKLDVHDLETVFEHFNLDPEEVLILLHKVGHFDIDYYMDDEWVDEEELEDEE